MELSGRTVVVTGAASGIGRSCALAFARAGGRVVVGDVDEVGGRAVTEAIASAGGAAWFVPCDVTVVDDVAGLLDRARQLTGRLDVLHNNAGIVCGEPLWPRTAPQVLLRQMEVNLGGVIVGTRLAVDAMAPDGGGVVVNTGSIGSLLPLADEPVYSATKAAVLMFTRACAALHQTHNVRVNAVLPGLVDTPLLAKTGDGTTEAAWAVAARQMLPVLSGDDVADVVLDFVHDDSLAGQYRIVGELPEFVEQMLPLPPPAPAPG